MTGKSVTHLIKVSRRGAKSKPMLSIRRKDRVKWQNIDDVRLQIKFATWPFTGKSRVISVAAKKQSTSLRVSPKFKFPYAVVPKSGKRYPGGPPDPPILTAGD